MKHFYMAERVGFEPTIPLPVWQFSRLLPSTTRPPLLLIELLAERGRFELPRRITSTYRFSKPAPSASWVPLHKAVSALFNRPTNYSRF